jgi:chromate transporter
VRRRWLDEQAYADLVGLASFCLAPPAARSDFRRVHAGRLPWRPRGMDRLYAAFRHRTRALRLWRGCTQWFNRGLLHGLKLVAVAIVAQVVWGMARTLCPDRERASIAVVAALLILFSTSSVAQIAAILLGGIAGLWLCRAAPPTSMGHISVPVSRTVELVALTAFFLLLTGLPVLRGLGMSQGVALFEAFYRSGALVFGGGHVRCYARHL